ncbi:MAG: DUF1800 family protein [Pirellulaceae bacterium]|nr:DUF1800 family protein [Pirellulaceae bacterium]
MALLDPYTGPWTLDEAAHLGRRAGFGRRPDELKKAVDAGVDAAVDAVVDYPIVDSALDTKFAGLPDTFTTLRNGEIKKNGGIKNPFYEWDLQNNWFFRMIHTNHPLQQQLHLFFHDHFVSDWQKVWATITDVDVRAPGGSNRGALTPWTQKIVSSQYKLLREAGKGPFRALLRKITRDPAMLIYLDNRINTKEKPQENFARELMELFSMGVGNYSEDDVREISRAMTGEHLNEREEDQWPFEYEFAADKHDDGVKTVFGKEVYSKTAGEEANQIIDLILDQVSSADISPAHSRLPATALYMSWKFLNWFVLETIPIDHPVVEQLGEHFYDTQADGDNYSVGELLRKIFKSQFFYDRAHRYAMYKHPMDYMIMAARNIELNEFSLETKWPARKNKVPVWTSEMGMQLFGAPNVSGWTHGRSWINSGNLIARFNLANNMSSNYYMTDQYCDDLITKGHVDSLTDTAGIIEFFRARLLQTDLRPEETAALEDLMAAVAAKPRQQSNVYRSQVRGCFHVMMTFPRYQMK